VPPGSSSWPWIARQRRYSPSPLRLLVPLTFPLARREYLRPSQRGLTGAGPWVVAFDPQDRVVFVADQSAGTVAPYSFTVATGVLGAAGAPVTPSAKRPRATFRRHHRHVSLCWCESGCSTRILGPLRSTRSALVVLSPPSPAHLSPPASVRPAWPQPTSCNNAV
jgi:hypothetical protein